LTSIPEGDARGSSIAAWTVRCLKPSIL
jgi:hypothetical protein